MVRHNNDVYSLGGYNTPSVYRLRDGNWTAMPSMSHTRHNFAAVLFDDTIYVFGGAGAQHSVEAFDIAAENWTNKTDMPMDARDESHAAVVFHGLVWKCGGAASSKRKSCFTYNPTTDVWATAAQMASGRYKFNLVVLGDYIYAMGNGLTNSPEENTSDQYDPNTDVWTVVPRNMTTKVNYAVVLPVGQ